MERGEVAAASPARRHARRARRAARTGLEVIIWPKYSDILECELHICSFSPWGLRSYATYQESQYFNL